MNQAQFFNQLLFAIFGLVLAGLYASTFRVGIGTEALSTRRYWLLSVGARAGAFLSWSLTPFGGAPFSMISNGLFIFSAGCLALLFRSWRINFGNATLRWVIVIAVAVSAGMEVLRQATSNFEYRMILLGSASLSMSAWELIELYKKIKAGADRSLKLIALIVSVQMVLSIASIISSILYADRNIVYITDNGTKSILFIWLTLTIHLVIYLFIGGYLYQRAIAREVVAVKEKNDVQALLEEREHLLASLISSNRAATTGALSASVAHEISQPLTASSLQLGLLKRALNGAADPDNMLNQLMSNLQGNIDRAKEILDKLRKMFQGRPTDMEQCSISELISRTVQLMHIQTQTNQISLRLMPAPSAYAQISEVEIQQVLINLINNAIDALSANSLGDRHILIEVFDHAEMVHITVADNGSGIDPKLASSMFELTRSNKHHGMGVGLWISKYIIESRHHGRLHLDLDHSPGAKFIIELPKQSAA